MRGERLQLTASELQEDREVAKHVQAIGQASGEAVNILEAGCGRKWTLDLGGIDYILTGVDRDADAISARMAKKDLHRAITGDLLDVALEPAHYDVIYNAFVLEHVDGAEKVLDNFLQWLRPKGIMVIKVPDPESVVGFITKVTPHWFHVFYYRHVLGNKHAGQPGFAPYPVFYDPVVSRNGIRAYCRNRGLELLAEYGDGWYRPGSGVTRNLLALFIWTVGLLSFGRLSSKHTNLMYIIQKP